MSTRILRFVMTFVTISLPLQTLAGENVTYDPNHIIQSVADKSSTKCATVAPDPLVDALCRNDTRAICSQLESSNEPTSQTIRAKALSKRRQELTDLSVVIGKILDEGATREQANQAAQRYAKIVKSTYKTIAAEYLARGKNIKEVENRIELLKNDLLARVEKYPSFQGTNAKEVVQAVRLVTPDKLANENNETILHYYISCGADGLADNDFYESSTRSLIVCPGNLLTILQMGGRPDTIDDAVGHELGHSVGPDRFIHEDQSFHAAYKDYISCLDSHDRLEFSKIETHLNLFKKRIPYTKNCLDILKRQTPVQQDKVDFLNSMMSGYKSKVEALSYFSHANPNFATDPVASHIEELAADFMGTETMADHIIELPVDQRARYVAANLKLFCNEVLPMVQEINSKDCVSAQPQFTPEESREWWSGDDGRHPSADYRFRAHLHHPIIRSALGCPALPVDDPHPWCSLSTPKSTEK